jgi:hypothetical protein
LFPALQRAKKQAKDVGAQDFTQGIDAGGEFYTSKSFYDFGGEKRVYRKDSGPSIYTLFSGDVLPTFGRSADMVPLPPLTDSDKLQLMAKGTTAISRCIPTNPVSGLANFLGELKRDGLPHAPGAEMKSIIDRGKPLKRGSSEFLNYEFAIKPTLSDIRSFAKVVKDHDKILKQFLRDSGKGIRRRYSFPTETTVTQHPDVTVGSVPFGGSLDSTWFSDGVLRSETVKTVDRWFSGEFCYYLNLDDGITGKISRHVSEANKLLGVRLTPELLWNLTPWSWAADWVTNAGDVLHNVSAFLSDGLVMRYGYIMEQTTVIKTYTLTNYGLKAGVTGSTSPLTLRLVQQRKVRLRASPFGFGLTDTDLSPRQLAIIAALGITRTADIAK